MTFLEIRAHKCLLCGRVYETLPLQCLCAFGNSYDYRGLLQVVRKNNAGAIVRCKLCRKERVAIGSITQGCDCIPKHISVQSIRGEMLEYICEKCKSVKHSHIPVLEFCCDDST